ncbi:unnamed protein product [Fraxinus pennsylvanica]|uniref:Formin-like protein n=1 Tax=Fraxinus pennsylvanica TaxID=56036 RepID=A0AAD2DTL7_9LAMI|nr:unnamed protein product [Fraxinus pennsylvanica]
MRTHIFSIFLILSLATSSRLEIAIGKEPRIQDSLGDNRRILHQPLFPDSSAPPPPQSEILPPPSPPLPPPSLPATPDQDQPFFHETGPTPDQVQQSPPAPANGIPVANPVTNQQQQAATKPIKKVAIAISVGTVALGMLSALAFYLYKHRVRHSDESQKLVGSNSQRTNEESRIPPSTFLYIGTVEPSTRGTAVSTDSNGVNGSPYRKLNSGKISDRYRPSPDLQPLPPLTKPPLPPSINSPPPMSSSDDESHETNFYTPQGSSMSNESPSSRHFYSSNNTGQMNQAKLDSRVASSVPHSKRTSPKSRLSASSPDSKYPIIPPIKQSTMPSPPAPTATSPLGPLQASRPALPNIPKRAKFSAPPPPPNMARLQSMNDEEQRASKFTMPPPPPPPPPPLPTPRKLGTVETNIPPVSKPQVRPQSKSYSPKSSPGTERRSPVKEVNKGESTSRKFDDDDDDKDGSKPKLKPLHWDKVRATSDRATVWDRIKSSSFQLNEDAMESLFGCNSANSVTKESTRKSLPPLEQNRVLDPKKSQNIAIMLRALNVTRDEVVESLLDGNPEGLGSELLETLVKMAPTKEEEIKLKDYSGDSSKLGTAERFLKAILDIPFAFKRVEAMLYRANFTTEVKYLRNSFQTLKEASEELKNSRLFLRLLEAVLRTGNRMNVGTNRGDARAFKLDTLLKLVDIKGTDGKTTLLHFVVQEIIRSEGASSDPIIKSLPHETDFRFKDEEFMKQGLQVVAGLSKELGSVKKAAGMDSDVLSSYVSKLEMGLEKVRLIPQNEKQSTQSNFFDSMKMFLKEAEEEITRIKAEERKALALVKEATEYFHGDTAKEEAHPLRIFMIVRDFLSILDNVCNDVGRMKVQTTVGAGRSFRVPVNASLPVLSRYNIRRDISSDDDSM